MSANIYSIGHSDLPLDHFVSLLIEAGINAVADVRSSPFSRRAPWFSQPEFRVELRRSGIVYSFLGDELGGRPKTSDLFKSGVADYVAMAKTPAFRTGLDRLLRGAKKYRIAMVCSERDPLHCHRCLLVGRQLMLEDIEVCHIHSSGTEEMQSETEERLLREEGLAADDLIWPRAERLGEAYIRRNRQVAYALSSVQPQSNVQ